MKTEHQKENQWILQMIRFRDYDPEQMERLQGEKMDGPYVLGQLLYNRVGGAAYLTLKECGLLPRVHRELRNSLKDSYRMARQKTEAFRKGLALLSEVFCGAGFPYAFLKGSVLAGMYPAGLRTSNDFDVLTAPGDVAACCQLLREHGFVQGRYDQAGGIIPATRQEIIHSRMNRGETVPFLLRSEYEGLDVIEVDVNFSLDFKAKHSENTVEDILTETVPFPVLGGKSLQTLGEEDFLIQLCVHLYKEAAVYNWVRMGRDLSLYKFLDLYLYLLEKGNAAFFGRLLERIRGYGLEGACSYALCGTAELFPGIRAEGLGDLLETLAPYAEREMDRVVRPENKKVYRWLIPFPERVFCSGREEYLRETDEEAAL